MNRFLSSALVCGLLAAGCSAPSLGPVYSSDALATDSALQGVWVCDSGDLRMRAVVQERPGPLYDTELTVWHRGKEKTRLALDTRLVQVGKDVYADLFLGRDELTELSGLYGGLVVPAHQVLRYEREDDALIVRMLEPSWLERAVRRDGAALPHRRVLIDGTESIVLTAQPGELQQFLAEHGDEPGAFGGPFCFTRAETP